MLVWKSASPSDSSNPGEVTGSWRFTQLWLLVVGSDLWESLLHVKSFEQQRRFFFQSKCQYFYLSFSNSALSWDKEDVSYSKRKNTDMNFCEYTMKSPNPNIFPKKELLIPEFQAYLSYPNTALYS